jgi:predicted dehydrogenase
MSSRADRDEIGVGVVGLGLMGRTHIRAYNDARKAGFNCRLVAVCDRNPAKLEGHARAGGNLPDEARARQLFDPKHVHATSDLAEFLADERVELVSVCTYTPSHVDIARAALAAGKHVIVEKPVSLEPKLVRDLDRAAARAGRLCMPAMCIRFWPGWSWLKDKIDGRDFGAVKSAVFQRLASPPYWARTFYSNPRQSGAALFDLHIHDADFVRFCFGAPKSVFSSGSIDHMTTHYRFARGPAHVVAEGGWDHSPGFNFRMRYLVVFERATAEYDLAREPVLTLTRGGRVETVKLEAATGYDFEVRHMLESLRAKRPELVATLEDAAEVARCLQAERKSIESGKVVVL